MIIVNGKEHPWRAGMTVADLLEELEEDYDWPVVRFGERVVSKPDFRTTILPDGAEVLLVPLVSGG